MNPETKTPTGSRRLDDLLGGGIPTRATALTYGPPFIGKELLTRLFLLEGLRHGEPAILLLTHQTAEDAREDLTRIDPRYPEYEQKDLVRIVDAYSRSIDAHDHPTRPHVTHADSPMDLNGISQHLNDAAHNLLPKHPTHRVVLDSISTLIAYTNAQTTFRFLMVLTGKLRRAGATSLLLLDQGMHTDAEVQTIQHLTHGLLQFKTENNRNYLHAQGLHITQNPGWIEYHHTPHNLELTGSFAASRIR